VGPLNVASLNDYGRPVDARLRSRCRWKEPVAQGQAFDRALWELLVGKIEVGPQQHPHA